MVAKDHVTKRRAVVGLVAAAALLAGLISPAFSSLQVETHLGTETVTSASLSVALASPGATDAISLPSLALLPGGVDSAEVTIKNVGSSPFGTLTLDATPKPPGNALVIDQVNGLKVDLLACPKPWTDTPRGGGGYTYSCPATASTLLPPSPVSVLARGIVLPAPLTGLRTGRSASFLVQISLPSSAPNEMKGLTTTLSYVFVVTQPTGASS